jgi:hypothetical protein
VDHVPDPPACEGGLEALTERLRQGLIELREEVPVPVEGDIDRRVAHPGLNRLRVSALGYGQGNAGMPQIMVVPMSAQSRLCRPPRYADLRSVVLV